MLLRSDRAEAGNLDSVLETIDREPKLGPQLNVRGGEWAQVTLCGKRNEDFREDVAFDELARQRPRGRRRADLDHT